MTEMLPAGRSSSKWTPEMRDKVRAAMLDNKHLLGHVHSAETRARMRAAQRLIHRSRKRDARGRFAR